MAFSGQEEIYGELIKQALQKQDIINGINRTNIPLRNINEIIISAVERKRKEIWNVAAIEMREWNDIEAELLKTKGELILHCPANFDMTDSLPITNPLPSILDFLPESIKKLLKELLEPLPPNKDWKKVGVKDFLSESSEVFIWILRICFYVIILALGEGVFSSTPEINLHPFNPGMIIALVLFTIFTIAMEIIGWLILRRERKTAERKYQDFKSYCERYEQDQNALQDAKKRAKQVLLEKGILPELRSVINSKLEPSYTTLFPSVLFSGLAEVIDPDYEISTESNEELQRLIKSMPGGSIGVAGSRGAGKTTLLRSLMRSEELQGRLSLSILISAPVEYNARDFILQIFAMVCSRVLELEGEIPQGPWKAWSEIQQSSVESNPGIPFLRFTSKRSIRTTALVFIIGGSFLMGGSVALLHTSIVTMYCATLGMSPSTLFPWGLFLVVCGIVGFFVNRRSQKELSKAKTKKIKSNLVEQAWRLLENIKFQQSYSSGWSGSLQLPLALAGSITSTVSLAQNQLSLPEIIEEYRKFLREVTLTSRYIVVIAIDEMDKIESDEKAERFLNEIKALFGIPYCFYLISISENAMSSFERRGLPFRDVFDSSFDRIIFVNYLNYQSANRLLSRRVIGLPIPFVCLCYCLSGGLPRDLIRKCRDLLEQSPENKTLADLSNRLILTDIQVVLRALTIKAKKHSPVTEIYQFLDMVNQLEKELAESKFPSKETVSLLHEMKQNTQKQEQTETPQTELVTYLYYVITLLEYFTNKADAATWENIKYEEVDQLAKIRQNFSTSLYSAWTMISYFRMKYGMERLK